MKGSKFLTPFRMLLVTLVLLLGTFALLVELAFGRPSVEGPSISIAEVYRLADRGQIRIATLLDEDAVILGQKCKRPGRSVRKAEDGSTIESGPCKPPTSAFHATYPESDVSTAQLIERMSSGGTEVVVNKQTGVEIIKLVLTFLYPLLILANLFGLIFLARGGDSSMGDLAGFSRLGKKDSKPKGRKSKKDEDDTPTTGVTFSDVGGAEESVAELREVTEYLTNPKKFEAYGASAPKGVLLFGPPGCGKTLLARAVAGEAGVPFFSVSGAEFIESLVGVGAARVRDLFRQVRAVAPAIVFIDEIDAVGRKRSGEGSTGGEREQTVNQLLVELDGFEVSTGIVLMGATNRPDILDPALLRPGRFDRHVTLEAPDLHGRIEILRLHARGKPLSESVDYEDIARRTPGFTGADLANVINEGALLAIREGEGIEVGPEHLSEAIQRVLHGPMRRGKLMTVEERKRLAYHEAGHALVAAGLGKAGSVQRISIVARGGGLGSSAITDAADRVLLTQSELQATLAVAMGGIAAEQVVFSEPSTTSDDDLAKANAIARDMVGIHGMSPEVGHIQLLSMDGGFLSEDPRLIQTVSAQSLAVFDSQVKALLESGLDLCLSLLTNNRRHLDHLADTLERIESLEGAELKRLLSAVEPTVGILGTNGAVDSPPGSRHEFIRNSPTDRRP